jgi:hypothetical protein
LHKKKNWSREKEEEDGENDASSVNSEEFHEMLDGMFSGKNSDFAEDLGRSASKQDKGWI